jgi:hypothetical protein
LLDESEALARALDLPLLLDWISELRASLGTSADVVPAAARLALERDGEIWIMRYRATVLRLTDRKGLALLARLVAEPGVELHVLDLMGAKRDGRHKPQAGIDVIDDKAAAVYRARLLDLREALAEAEGHHDIGRVERAQAEIDALEAEVARALGLGGRRRQSGSDKERARVAVQRRLRDVIRRITAQAPEVGAHLETAVRTGTTCVYRPA